ncbi:hypothetical protein F5B19DRAFT_114625 [Rostrohypoxylon terebratum]|nr:hypothetical protein F5B19DRAFT_114625 [Rostrohypoxylon terebratum]
MSAIIDLSLSLSLLNVFFFSIIIFLARRMESLRQQDRNKFLCQIKNKKPECRVFELTVSENAISNTDQTMHVDEIQDYIQADSKKSNFKFVIFQVGVWMRSDDQNPEFGWIFDLLTERGVKSYLINMQDAVGCQIMEQELHAEGKLVNTVFNNKYFTIYGSYSKATKCTICFCFQTSGATARRSLDCAIANITNRKRLCRNEYFLPLVLMNALVEDFSDYSYAGDFDVFSEDNLRTWDWNRASLRLIQRDFYILDDIANFLRKHMISDAASRNATDSHTIELKEFFTQLELQIFLMKRELEWELRRNDDFQNKIARAIMREDTMASIELSRAGVRLSEVSVELTKAAKIDSSSMKVIAVMTMVFLPGTFFATLFAVPSLNWNGDDIVGENFWMYWAFTIPFTVLVIVLWLAITQRRQMKTVLEASRVQWLAKVKVLQDLSRKKGEPPAAAGEGKEQGTTQA